MQKFFVSIALSLALVLTAYLPSVLAREASPQWVAQLADAQEAKQLFVAAGVGKTTAWISLHEKDSDGKWQQLMTTPGFIGREGLGKTKEGDSKTPVGIFRFDAAFGLAPDPGCAIPYTQVDGNIYWSGDTRPGMMYNQMVDIRQCPGLDKENSEHIADYTTHYVYCLNVSYNDKNIPGKGSAIFVHCFAPAKPYTGGCISLPKDKMLFLMQTVRPDCIVVIDSLENLGGTF